MGESSFGSPSTLSGYTDNYAYTDGVPIPLGRQAANGKHPIIVTHLRGYASGRSGTRSGVMKLEGGEGRGSSLQTSGFSVGSAGSANSTGWIGGVSRFYPNGGTSRFVIDLDGSFYFGRGGGGSTVDSYGYSWSGGLAGGILFVESPTSPNNLGASPHPSVSGRITLAWNGPSSDGGSGITGYRVYWHTNAAEINAGRALGSWDVGGGTAEFNGQTDVIYYFRVAARNSVTDNDGTTSHWSNTASARAPGLPGAPRDLKTVASTTVSGRIDLTWTVPAFTVNGLTGYDLYRNGVLIAKPGPSDLSYASTGLTPNTSYSYYLRARNSFADANNTAGPSSNTSTATAPGVPSAPLSLTATASTSVSGRIALSWQPPTTAPGGITGYKIYRNGTLHTTTSTATTSINIDNHTIGTSYSFYVTALNAFATSSGTESPASNTATATGPGLPGAPTGLTATASTNTFGRVTLNWTAPTDTGGGIVTYRIFSSGVSIGSVAGNVTTFNADNLTQHASHTFTVRARNQFATDNNTYGPDSNSATAVAPGPPSAPLNLAGTADQVVAGRVTLTWSPPTVTGGGITSYTVAYDTGVTIGTTAGNVTTYQVNNLSPGSTYGFIVKAWNSVASNAGTAGPWSNTATVQALGDPEPPTGLTVTPSAAVSGRLIVSWGNPGGANGYSVFKDNPNGTPVAIVKGTTYMADNLALNVAHTYYVRARNSVTDAAGTTGGDPVGPASGTPSSTTVQTTPNYTATDVTNEAFNGTYPITTVGATSLSYSKTMGNLATLAVSSGTLTNTTNQALNGPATITTPATNTIAFTKTVHDIVPGTSVSNGTIINNTNQSFNGIHELTGADGTNGIIQWADSQYDVGPVATTGTITNTTNVVYNDDDAVITAATSDTFSYLRSGQSNQALSSATGTATNLTNRDLYNGVQTVSETATYDTFSYQSSGGNGAETLPDRELNAPLGEASRVQSPAELEILYRSGWAG